MPLKNYGVLVGRVVASRAEGGADSPHFQVHIRGSDTDFRIAVNVLSKEKPSELLYFADEHFSHPLLALLATLPEGFTELPSQRGGVALDFIRGNLFERTAMKVMPATSPGPDNDLPTNLTTSSTVPRLTHRRWSMPSVSGGVRNQASQTRSSVSNLGMGCTTST